jgi:hypothetical protein
MPESLLSGICCYRLAPVMSTVDIDSMFEGTVTEVCEVDEISQIGDSAVRQPEGERNSAAVCSGIV